MPDLFWTLTACAASAALAAALAWWAANRPRMAALPKEWAVTPRPVFNLEERAAYRLLRDALPHHVVLAKLPLVRFCQPLDAEQTRYWYDLLGALHVGFAVCSPNGRVLAVVDLDLAQRGTSRRAAAIKEAVFEACRVRYVKYRADQLPSIAELQMLVPHQGLAARPAVPERVAAPLQEARATLAHTVRARRAERNQSVWNDSLLSSDSFFMPDSRLDGFGQTDPAALESVPPPAEEASPDVVRTRTTPSRTKR